MAETLSKKILSPMDRLTELMSGVIMTVTLTAYLRVSTHGEVSSAILVSSAIGCNLAWGLIDGTFFWLNSAFTRARQHATVTKLLATPNIESFTAQLESELPSGLRGLTEVIDATKFRQMLTANLPEKVSKFRKDDLIGAIAVCLVDIWACIPVLLPLIVIKDPQQATRLSHTVATALLAIEGAFLAKSLGRPAWFLAAFFPVLGLFLTLLCAALGG